MSPSLGFLRWLSSTSLAALRFASVPEPSQGFPPWKSQGPSLVSEGRKAGSWVRSPALRKAELLHWQSPAGLAPRVRVRAADGVCVGGLLGHVSVCAGK